MAVVERVAVAVDSSRAVGVGRLLLFWRYDGVFCPVLYYSRYGQPTFTVDFRLPNRDESQLESRV